MPEILFTGGGKMIIKQIEIGHMANFCYIVGCAETRKALVIDPGADVERILSAARDEGVVIESIVNTHGHSDHTAGNGLLKASTGARILLHSQDADYYPAADVLLTDEAPLHLGNVIFGVLHTPGHSPGGICLYAPGNLFTGDTLFVGDSGRTDLPGGHRATLGASIRRLMQLPEDTVVWPGHDYGPTPSSTIGWEKRHNVNAREYGYHVTE
jgi:glyoxylase-like metal-dependent hydrolase (beta-lactamase superfamily II)